MRGWTARDWVFLGAIVAVCFGGAFSVSRAIAPRKADLKPTDWLLAADSADDRARLLQRQLRGFDLAMWEVGSRFAILHDALSRENYDLAVYEWDKIGVSITNALVRRPAKALHAREFLLGQPFGSIREDLVSADPRRAWPAFERARTACQSCHGAEGVAYVNSQALFDLKAAPARQR
jgi:hypothetical protein